MQAEEKLDMMIVVGGFNFSNTKAFAWSLTF